MGIVLALLLFSFIVFFHELGHFLLAKKNGIRVEEFFIGMGPVLCSRQVGETKYSIRLLPIGGACMMGEDDAENTGEGNFNSKSVWARISVIAAGPFFNFLLAFLFSVIIVAWVGYDQPIVGGFTEHSAAQEAGMREGDEIIGLNGRKIRMFREIAAYNQFHQGETMEIAYKRDGKAYQVTVQPKKDANGMYMMGVQQGGYQKANPFTALQYGAYTVKYWISTTLESLKMMVTGKVGMDQLSGPVGIVDVVDETYQANKTYGISSVLYGLISMSILLSANLGVMNLLPLPALDGGRLVFLIVEAIRGKRVPPEKEGMVHFAGIVLLFGLMIFIALNDLKRIF